MYFIIQYTTNYERVRKCASIISKKNMNKFGFKLENTIKVEILADERPRSGDIERFLEDSGVDVSKIVGFYDSSEDNSFFVKFIEGSDMVDSVQKMHSVTMRVNGLLCEVKSLLMEHFETTLVLRNLPFEVSDEIMVKYLEKYGTVRNVTWQKTKLKSGHEIYNGIRTIQMQISKIVPPYIYVMGVRVNATFKYQRDMCYSCMSIQHHRNACSSRQNVSNISDNIIDDKLQTQTEDTVSPKDSLVCVVESLVDSVTVERKKKKQKKKNRTKRDASQQTEFDKIYEDRIAEIDKQWERGDFSTMSIIDRLREADVPVDSYFHDQIFLTFVVSGKAHDYPLRR